MGCHTWFSSKLEIQPTYKELQEKFLSHLKKEMGYFERHISGTLSDKEKWLFEDKTIEQSKHILNILNRQYRLVSNGYCKLATYRKYGDVADLDFCERNNLFYKDNDEEHDVFRIGGYLPDELLSLEETLDFLEKNNDKIFWGSNPNELGKEKVIEKLKEFWNKNPDGRIRFG